MPERTIEDRLREEYFDLLPEIRRVVWQLEAEIRFHTLPILRSLEHHEQLVVRSRIKECESAVTTLREEEGKIFDPDRPGDYSMLNLPDLAGVRVLVFPNSRLQEVNGLLCDRFRSWEYKPVKDDSGAVLAQKYFGYCNEASKQVRGEYQVVSMLLGLFWEVEHSAMYKFKAVAESKMMQERRAGVYQAMSNFESGLESFRS